MILVTPAEAVLRLINCGVIGSSRFGSPASFSKESKPRMDRKVVKGVRQWSGGLEDGGYKIGARAAEGVCT